MSSVMYNVTSNGLTAGTDCSAALQTLVDSVGPTITGKGAVFYFPADSNFYEFSAPVYVDFNNIYFVGDGTLSTQILSLNSFSPFLFGITRKVAGNNINSNHWVDL